MKLASETERSVILSSSRRKRKRGMICSLWSAPPLMSQERVPAGRFSGRGFQVCCAGRWLRAHLTAPVCSSFQHPGDRLPPSARVAAPPPVRRLRAADRGAAQAPPPGALRDGRQPRGRQGSDGRPPRRPGTDLRSRPLAVLVGHRAAPSAGPLRAADAPAVRVSASCSSKGREAWDWVSAANKATHKPGERSSWPA